MSAFVEIWDVKVILRVHIVQKLFVVPPMPRVRLRMNSSLLFARAGGMSARTLRSTIDLVQLGLGLEKILAGRRRPSSRFVHVDGWGKTLHSEIMRLRTSSMFPVPLNSSKITSSIREPVSTSAVAMMVFIKSAPSFLARG